MEKMEANLQILLLNKNRYRQIIQIRKRLVERPPYRIVTTLLRIAHIFCAKDLPTHGVKWTNRDC